MPAQDPESVRASPYGARRRRAAAWAGSAAVHVLAVLVVAPMSMPTERLDESAVQNVVWLGDMPPPLPEFEPPVEPEPAAEAEVEVQPDPALENDVEPEQPPGPEARSAADEPAQLDDAPDEDAPDEDAPDEDAAANDGPPADNEDADGDDTTVGGRTIIVRDVDWEEERRRAVARVSDRLAEQYPTFSADDLAGEPRPEDPDEVEDIFEASAGAGLQRSLLKPGASGGPVGRRITALCDALGGIGIGFAGFGIGSLCAPQRETYKLFASIKPEYLRARPECVENPGAQAPSGSDSAIGDPTVKCRLVVDGETGSADPFEDRGVDVRPEAGEPRAPDGTEGETFGMHETDRVP